MIAVLHCGTPWVLAPRARLFHLILRQHLFHSSTMIVPKYFMQTAALLHLNSLLNPFLVPLVWPLLLFLQARPHKYYPCTTNSIMRAVKRGKPTALSVFITLGRPGCKWKEIRGLLFLLMGRGRAGLASLVTSTFLTFDLVGCAPLPLTTFDRGGPLLPIGGRKDQTRMRVKLADKHESAFTVCPLCNLNSLSVSRWRQVTRVTETVPLNLHRHLSCSQCQDL